MGTSMPPFGRWRRPLERLPFLVHLFVLFSPGVFALHVVPGSNCTAVCTQNVTSSNTASEDITCFDKEYNSTSVGTAFQSCISCEMESHTFDQQTKQTDLGWALFNMRYAVDTCIFKFPGSNNQTVSATCQDCTKLSASLETNIQNPSNSTAYDYCRDAEFVPNIDGCAACYSVHPDQVYLSNFLKTLKSACITQPSNTEQFVVNPSDVFTLDPPANFPTNIAENNPHPVLPHGAVVAIGICVPVFFFLVLSLVFLYCYLRIQNRHTHKPRPKRHRKWSEKRTIEPHHGWHQESTSRIRPVSYIPPIRTRYSNPLAQIVENPEQPSDHSDAGNEDPEKDPKQRLEQTRPPSGLMTWERRGVEDAAVKNIRFSDSMNSTHNSTFQTSGSTTIIPSPDGRRDSAESASTDEEVERLHRERQQMTPPPLFSIPETGSSSTFIPARSGNAWDNNRDGEAQRSTSRHSRRRSEELQTHTQRSISRASRPSEEASRSLSRGAEEAMRSTSSGGGEEARRSVSRAHSRRSDSIETRLEEASREPPSPRGEGMGLFRHVSYEPRPDD